MKNLIFIGAGESSIEILAWANPFLASMGLFFKGFLDDNASSAFAKIKEYAPIENDVFICTIGSTLNRMKCCQILRSKGAQFINLIHPTAIVLSPLLSTGIVVAPFVYIANNVTIADDVFINVSSIVGHDVSIGRSAILSSNVDLTGHVQVEELVFLGSHACVIPGKRLGRAATIGAGSMVAHDIPESTTALGVPAKKLFKSKPVEVRS